MNCEFFTTSLNHLWRLLIKAYAHLPQFNFWSVLGLKALRKVLRLPYSIAVKCCKTFSRWDQKSVQWSHRNCSRRKNIRKYTICSQVFFFVCCMLSQTSYCPNLRAIEQIPFEVSALSEKHYWENGTKKNPLPRKQTPPTNAFNEVLRWLSQ